GSISRTVDVSDVVAPSVQITSPVQNAALDPRSPIGVVVTAADAVGVTSMSFSATGVVSAAETRAVPSSATRTETFTVNVTPLPAPGGTLTLAAAARDAAGNTGTAPAVTVRILDVVAPNVDSIQPANGATGVDPAAPIVVRFTEPMDRATLTAASI